MAPMFVHMYPRLAEAAREVGYALALHGTLGRDFDMVAVPWTDAARDPDVLVEAIAKASGGYAATQAREVENGPFVDLPKRLPHGRLGYLIFFRGGTGYIDLSVMPRQAA